MTNLKLKPFCFSAQPPEVRIRNDEERVARALRSSPEIDVNPFSQGITLLRVKVSFARTYPTGNNDAKDNDAMVGHGYGPRGKRREKTNGLSCRTRALARMHA